MVLGFATWFVATRAHVETELSRLLPEGATPTERLLLTELRTGATGRLILIALEGEDADLLAGASKQLAAWMRESGAFHYVGNGEQAWTKEERERLFQYRYVLSPSVQESTFSRAHLRDSLELRLSDLTSPLSPMVKELIPGDPTGEFMKILQAWMTWTAPARHQGVWFSSDLRRALLVAETHAAGFDMEAQEQLQGQIRAAFRSVAGTPSGAAPVQLVMTGPSVIAVEMRQTIQDDVWRLSLCATLLVTTFLFVSYGSISILALSLLPLTSAILAGIAITIGIHPEQCDPGDHAEHDRQQEGDVAAQVQQHVGQPRADPATDVVQRLGDARRRRRDGTPRRAQRPAGGWRPS